MMKYPGWTVVLFSGLLAAAAACAAAENGANVVLTLHTNVNGPVISRHIFGQFAEHLGRGIYEGIWVGPDSPIPNTRGIRNDVVTALKALHVPNVRWPGGCFADEYHWRKGIGVANHRPATINANWGGVTEPNTFGTHEFMDFLDQIGARAYLSVNVGSGTVQEAADWLEYLTAGPPDALGAERAANGHAAPYQVAFVGIGNESWGCGGNMRPEYQADLHNRYATFLNNGALRVASGDGTGNDHLIDVLMERSIGQMDALTLHYYTIPGDWTKKGSATGFDAAAWAHTLKLARGIEPRIEAIEALMDKRDPQRRIGLFVDEWGTWYDTEPGANPGFLYQQNTLRDALVAALTLDVFQRHTDRVRMTSIAQMVNVLQAMVLADGRRMALTPTYHVYDMYKPFKGATPLKIRLSTTRWQRGEDDLPAVDASVARTADGATVVALVNLDPERPAHVRTNLKGEFRGSILTAAKMDAHNTFDQPHAIEPAPFSARAGAEGWTLDLPPKTVLVVSAPVRH